MTDTNASDGNRSHGLIMSKQDKRFHGW